MAELLNCPFCGRAGTVENPEPDCFAIGCDDCCFSMMDGNVGIGWYATEAEAIAAWNRRAPSNDARDAVTLLEALLPYAEHADSCGDMDAYNNADVQRCGCGLDSLKELVHEAIAAAENASKEGV